MFHIKFNACLDKIHLKTQRRIAEDLRKAGAIAGVGLVGFVLSNDNIDYHEAITILLIGIIFWLLGLLNGYIADKIEQRSMLNKQTTPRRKV